jgi:hypothetical protein
LSDSLNTVHHAVHLREGGMTGLRSKKAHTFCKEPGFPSQRQPSLQEVQIGYLNPPRPIARSCNAIIPHTESRV